MSRLIQLAVVFLALSAASISRVPAAGNEFISELGEWVRLRNAMVLKPGTVDAGEVRQWEILKRRWKELERVVEAER